MADRRDRRWPGPGRDHGCASGPARRLPSDHRGVTFPFFAIEPAVGYLARRGWRRGPATGLVFLAVFILVAALIALLVPAIVTGARQLISALPDLANNLARYLRPLGIKVDTAHIDEQVRQYGSRLLSGAASLLGGVVRVATGIIGGLFQALAIAFFTFYMVAQGPQMRRAVLSQFPPERQRRILFIWEQAISQTGGYFYSRLLLAVVNGALMYAVLRWRAVPFAVPLSLLEGLVAEFMTDRAGRVRWHGCGGWDAATAATLAVALAELPEPAEPAEAAAQTPGTGAGQSEMAFDPRFRLPLAALGITPSTAHVTVTADRLVACFGPRTCRTSRRMCGRSG